MNERLVNFKNKISGFWGSRSKAQKIMLASGAILLIAIIAISSIFASRTTMVPLYSNLSPAETGSIKANLDGRGVQSEITDNGKTIMVPEEMVDTLKVELAAEGIPDSGSIDYSFFSQNAGIGMTDNEFQVLKLESMQTELSNLIKGIEGVNDANVMISLPKEGVFLNDSKEEASASIVLSTKPGYQFEDSQIRALYHLVSKSVPNLPTDNIVIMNQDFEYFDLKNENKSEPGASFATQNEIKKEIERDIQRQVQNMLGTLMGRDKVVVSVSADIDFTQENREENLVTPVDEENMAGIAISAQRINETYTGDGKAAAGIPQSGDPNDTTNYPSDGTTGNGNYERKEETINNEVNRIKKEIVESPYNVRDLGIQVMVEPPKPNDPNSLPQARVDDITKMLSSIIRTSIDKGTLQQQLTDQEIQNKISVSVQEFNGKMAFAPQSSEAKIPLWVYIVGGVLVLAIIILLILFIRSRRKDQYEEEFIIEESMPVDVPDVNNDQDTESSLKRKQLEKLAKEKPEEFAKLLRSWIAED
ncbi:flagellar basal-body MS-ring/collar protein FliF [Peribacillus sp. SCS-155]|uniref:flagellar basal-body MS-ring/collar protein FliF n=1 Tax=Peribacillus sedimenti TaxID=3115297 RepID=UPI0039065F66